jgi:hypothetical protein
MGVTIMPIKYVATLGAVAGIVQTVNAVEISCNKPTGIIQAGTKPSSVTIQAAARLMVTVQSVKPAPVTKTGSKPLVQISVSPTLKPKYGGA